MDRFGCWRSPCGSSILGLQEQVLAVGRNHVYDAPTSGDTRTTLPLQYTRLAHAELNALACIPTKIDPGSLTLWTTQHPCLMCAAALQFIEIGKVWYIADDPSDTAPSEKIIATRGNVPYEALGDPLWWTISNLLFLYNSAQQQGEDANNLRKNRHRYPALVRLTLELVKDDALGQLARAGEELPQVLIPYSAALHRTALEAPSLL